MSRKDGHVQLSVPTEEEIQRLAIKARWRHYNLPTQSFFDSIARYGLHVLTLATDALEASHGRKDTATLLSEIQAQSQTAYSLTIQAIQRSWHGQS